MDEYNLFLLVEGKKFPNITPKVIIRKDVEEGMSSPYVESLLTARQPERYGVALLITEKEQNDRDKKNVHWTTLSDLALSTPDATIHMSSIEKATDVLFQLAERLPAAGCYILNIFWSVKNFDDSSLLRKWSPLLGALRKLCEWHKGHLHVFVADEITERTSSIIGFVDKNAEIIKESVENVYSYDSIIWRGNVDILSQGTPLHSLPGFVLLPCQSQQKSKITVEYRGNEQQTSKDAKNESFSEENKEHVWFNSCINLLEFIDITTIPLFLLSGKKFVIEHKYKDEESWKQVKYLHDVVRTCYKGGFLCSLDYAISSGGFEPVPEHSTKNWQQAILNTPGNLSAPKFRFHHKVSQLHLLLLPNEKNEEQTGKMMCFTAHLFHPIEDMSAAALTSAEVKACFYPTASGKKELIEADPAVEKLVNLPAINPEKLFFKDERFNTCISRAIKEWTDENETYLLPLNILQDLVQKTSQDLNSAQDRTLLDTTNLGYDRRSFGDNTPKNCQFTTEEKIHSMELQALSNADMLRAKSHNKLLKLKSSDSLRTSTAGKAVIDMHLQPFDVLKYFLPNGLPKNHETIQSKGLKNNYDIPSPSKLTNFEESLKISYHGITYNDDERAAEKHDRMCRRLVERQVKFETSSIGSSEKVPSPATMNIADSPIKRSTLASESNSSFSEMEKRKQLQKVAEKLYKKRIQSRSSLSSARPTTSMVLRSTPTKSRPGLIRRSSNVSLQSTSSTVSENNSAHLRRLKSLSQIPASQTEASDEEKRQRRRTYVQDNKKRLQELITKSLAENGIQKESKLFPSCSKRLYNVSMAFLRDLKSSKDLDKIMKQTVENNVQSVISFNRK